MKVVIKKFVLCPNRLNVIFSQNINKSFNTIKNCFFSSIKRKLFLFNLEFIIQRNMSASKLTIKANSYYISKFIDINL